MKPLSWLSHEAAGTLISDRYVRALVRRRRRQKLLRALSQIGSFLVLLFVVGAAFVLATLPASLSLIR
jgi:hypothetical protein